MHTIIGNNWDFDLLEEDTLLDVSCLYTDINFQQRFIRLKKCVFPISQKQFETAMSNSRF